MWKKKKNIYLVRGNVVEQIQMSVCRHSQQVGFNEIIIWRLIWKELALRDYQVQIGYKAIWFNYQKKGK